MGLGAPKGKAKDAGGLWCCTEKIHGANLSIHLDRVGRLKCAKRTGFLAKDDNFFGHFTTLSRLREPISRLGEAVLAKEPGCTTVAFFGELCGGQYPHEDVEAEPHAFPVQQGIWYSPRVEFVLFDIALIQAVATESHFLPYKQTVELAEAHGLPHVKPLLVGSRGACASHSPKFVSKIPQLLGYPPILKDNWAEGFVAKPYDAASPMTDRPIFKVKIKEFSEGEGGAPPAGDAAMEDYLKSLVNPNRVAAAASKVGDPRDRSHWSPIVELVLVDLVEEVGVDDETFLRLLDQLRCQAFDLLCEL